MHKTRIKHNNHWFQSLIWVACPTGSTFISIIASESEFQSLIWVACPTGLGVADWCARCNSIVFQSLIWVACPTGVMPAAASSSCRQFQSLIWVACPTGLFLDIITVYNILCFNPSYGLHALRAFATTEQSAVIQCFNPSYGLHALRASCLKALAGAPSGFQSLIWVACPTGVRRKKSFGKRRLVSIPHMGCMPYGLTMIAPMGASTTVSIPHMGCMPYGPARRFALGRRVRLFQSLIWVACPTGSVREGGARLIAEFQSLIWVACPTGGSAAGASRTLRPRFQSLIWVACPTGLFDSSIRSVRSLCFNPSYGLHALRASALAEWLKGSVEFQSLIWVACPTGFFGVTLAVVLWVFQSLIWVACPTGVKILGGVGVR